MGWVERNREHPNYRRMDYAYAQHHARFSAYVQAHGLVCQACRGRGCSGHDSDYGAAEPCGWCETTGKVTRWLRGLWLREMARDKRERQARKKVRDAVTGTDSGFRNTRVPTVAPRAGPYRPARKLDPEPVEE